MKLDELTKGILKNNPVFYLMLGLCPFLAISSRVDNAIGMSLCVLFVLLGSEIVISLFRKWIPPQVRIPCFIVVIATFVTVIDLFLHGFAPDLYKRLGIFVPLIVVNCIILGRIEAFASKRSVSDSILDAIGMSIGFLIAIVSIALFREILGTGRLAVFGYTIIPTFTASPANVMILPPGAFLMIAIFMALLKYKGII
jgi:electron transport complex protein RnfE